MFDREGDHSYLHIPSYHMCLPLGVKGGVYLCCRGDVCLSVPLHLIMVGGVGFRSLYLCYFCRHTGYNGGGHEKDIKSFSSAFESDVRFFFALVLFFFSLNKNYE